jgi:hypothetical protein
MKEVVSKECFLYETRSKVITHQDCCLQLFEDLATFLQEKVFGVGELCIKHLIPIMSVLGILLS